MKKGKHEEKSDMELLREKISFMFPLVRMTLKGKGGDQTLEVRYKDQHHINVHLTETGSWQVRELEEEGLFNKRGRCRNYEEVFQEVVKILGVF